MTTALLFDLDGTLVDTDHLHLDAFNHVFGRFGVAMDRAEYTQRVMGKANLAIAAALVPDLPAPEAVVLLDEKERIYRELVRELTPIDGLVELLDWAAEHDLACGVVTNAPRANADLVLGALKLRGRFREVVIADELPEMKPHPLPYLTALERLGASAAHSVVFEDSPSGITAGTKAGMPVFGLMTSMSEAALIAAGAALAIADYRDGRVRGFIEARRGTR